MTTQPVHKRIGDIFGTNSIRVRPNTNAKYFSFTLLSSHMAGAPVIDQEGKYLGFISEFDVLRALREGKDLELLTAKDIMSRHQYSVKESTPIEDAGELMEDKHLLNLPVENHGEVTRTITRHDLLRAWLGTNISIDL